MQPRFQLLTNGQEVQQDDFNLLGKTSSLADDRVLAELLRLSPGGGFAKAILPFAYQGNQYAATVSPSTGGVLIYPFRAVVASRALPNVNALDNWTDIRSAVFVGSNMGTGESFTYLQTLTANASGSPRWTLVYAAVAVDANGPSVTRYQKDATTKVVSPQSVVTQLVTTVTIATVDGTPGATPVFPDLPSDAGGVYNIPLAYVRVPDGFTGASVVGNRDINDQAPVVGLQADGSPTIRPSTSNSFNGKAGVSGAGTTLANGPAGWTGTANTRPAVYMPPSMTGGESLLVAIDVRDASSANWSHANNSIIDESRDWRNRVFRWFAVVGTNAGNFPWINPGGAVVNPLNPLRNSAAQVGAPGYTGATSIPAQTSGVGFSGYYPGTSTELLVAAVSATAASGAATPAPGANMPTLAMTTGTVVGLVVDHTTGVLKLTITGTPGCTVFFWLDASAPYVNL